MTILTIKRKYRAPKLRLIQLRCSEELFKKIKASVPKDKSVSMHQILISVLENAFLKENLKINITESDDVGSDKKRGVHD